MVIEMLDAYGDDAKIIAGGTALTIFHKLGMLSPEHLVSLAGVSDLQGVSLSDEFLTIGSMTRLRDLEVDPVVQAAVPALARLLRLVANLRVRNMATLGGNLAEGDPTTDPPALLMALGSEVRLVSSEGERLVRLEEFFLGHFSTVVRPDEVLTEVRIPRSEVHASYVKYVSRHAEDRTCLGAAAVIASADDGSMSGLSVGIVGADQIPLVARLDEHDLEGVTRPAIYEELAERLLARSEPLSDSRGSADYKRKVLPRLVVDACERAESGRQEATRW